MVRGFFGIIGECRKNALTDFCLGFSVFKMGAFIIEAAVLPFGIKIRKFCCYFINVHSFDHSHINFFEAFIKQNRAVDIKGDYPGGLACPFERAGNNDVDIFIAEKLSGYVDLAPPVCR